ncbi:hypothetical protein [Neisseria wadsworthii]|nr:hypothetical protein [Neisseria wadsworthii]
MTAYLVQPLINIDYGSNRYLPAQVVSDRHFHYTLSLRTDIPLPP